MIDLDADGHPVGIDIDHASQHLDLGTLDLRRVPFGGARRVGAAGTHDDLHDHGLAEGAAG